MPLNCLLSTACYIPIVFKYGTPHKEVAYAHQASKLRALKLRASSRQIVPKDQIKLCTHDKKNKQANTKTCRRLGQNN